MGCTQSEPTVSMGNGQSNRPYPTQPVPQHHQHHQYQNGHQPQSNNHYPPQPQPQHHQQPSAPPLESGTHSGQSNHHQNNNMETESPEVILNMLKRYIELEKTVRPLEEQNVVGTLAMKKENLTNIQSSIEQTEKQYKAATDKVAKEKADVDKLHEPSVRGFFKDQTSFDEKLSKEQEEYLEAVNAQEVVKSQLDSLKSQHATVQQEIEKLTNQVKTLNNNYDEQEGLLDKIFSGEYGSEVENKLEFEVNQIKDRKDRVSLAKYKWNNSRVLLQHACNQLALAVRRWYDLPQSSAQNVQQRYQIATECRNNLIAASQNITSAQRYLSNIKFPYCERSEIDTLNRACNNIYVDMQTQDRHHHAYQCYSVTHKRAAALLQWFNTVIEGTIEKDVKQVSEFFNKKSTELRQERLRLIKERMGDKFDELGMAEGEFESLMVPPQSKQTEMVQEEVVQPDLVKTEDGKTLTPDEASPSAPTPLPLEELAPAPSTEELFGNIEQLRKQHEQEMKEFEKAQEMNKARMEQGLQEKLRQRRNRRDKKSEEN